MQNKIDPHIYSCFSKRIGQELLKKRLRKQKKYKESIFYEASGACFYARDFKTIYHFLTLFLKATRLYSVGRKNTQKYSLVENEIEIKGLPQQFKGFRILHISDLHLDSIGDNWQFFINKLCAIHADICVFTGDLTLHSRNKPQFDPKEIKKMLQKLRLPMGAYGVLGNHDILETVPLLEKYGLRMLTNESIKLEKNGEAIWLAGIDDSYYYKCDDIAKSLENVPKAAVKILLSHCPDIFEAADQADVRLLLCGHTHGGQICLPGAVPILTNACSPRSYCSGPWQYKSLLGYTSRGAGTSGVPIRFFCPPEITIHTLR